ncbi:MAG: thiamine diphosphokinase [Lutibacter sp.]
MKSNRAFLLLNGQPPKQLPNLSNYKMIVATDGAYQYLKNMEITPHFISGDFDSLKSLPNDIEIINTPNQNYTDFDKVLKILYDKDFKEIDVYGASGKEPDHFIGNISTALAWKEKLNLKFIDDFGTYFFIKNKFSIAGVINKTVSLIPFYKAESINTIGLEYPLKHEHLMFGNRIGTRNKAVSDHIEISFKSGNLLIYISH